MADEETPNNPGMGDDDDDREGDDDDDDGGDDGEMGEVDEGDISMAEGEYRRSACAVAQPVAQTSPSHPALRQPGPEYPK